MDNAQILWFRDIGKNDLDRVGGKNASLGEMICYLSELGVRVPNGFATTAHAYRTFLSHNGLNQTIVHALERLDVDNLTELKKAGATIRQAILNATFPTEFEQEIQVAYAALEQESGDNASFAVRSSATAEDLPDASFAGQQETVLNVRGIDDILRAMKIVFASLFRDRAIAYRVHHGFEHDQVALSVGVQKMVRSDRASSGVMFSVDTESGFDQVVFITASYGLGEMVVQGSVNPDEFYLDKRCLGSNRRALVRKQIGSKAQKMIYATNSKNDHTVQVVSVDPKERDRFSISDQEATELAHFALTIEKHYGCPMDIEWAKDGYDSKLYIVQARPETVKSRQDSNALERYILMDTGKVLVEGRSVGQAIGQGTAKILRALDEMDTLQAGDVLVTDMTDPDWEPIMKRARAIVTNRGGRTCHAAIIARELGIPAVVGCGNATELIPHNQAVTVSCAEGETGKILEGLVPFEIKTIKLDSMPKLPFALMMNVGNPLRAFDLHKVPNEGVGLARLEFVINQMIGIHPNACLQFDRMPKEIQNQIRDKMKGYLDPVDFYVQKIVEGVTTLGSAFAPKRIIVRFSDFKSNEYANLIGGMPFEPHEENPMIGFRGASRYVSPEFRDAFELECRAINIVRQECGFKNIEIMIPFVRTVEEAKAVVDLLAKFGLERGKDGLKIQMMCEVPSNALLAKEFLHYFDGFSIGSNDLTQLILGLDRDSGLVANLFDERNAAVKVLLLTAIKTCKQEGKYIGICGQGPSDHPDFAKWLMEQGIDSVSLTPDSVIPTWYYLAQHAR